MAWHDADQPDDLDPPITAEERAAAEAFRLELEAGKGGPFVDALKAAYSPVDLEIGELETLVRHAIGKKSQPSRRALIVLVPVTASLAMAAAALLLITPKDAGPVPSPLAASRSTQELFEQPFARIGDTSVRVDKIARARNSDFRMNYYSRRGVGP